MTITATRLAAQHRGSAAANTRTHEGLSFVEGNRYAVVVEALQNGTGSWSTEATFAVTDNHENDWTTVAVSADPGSTAGGTNGVAICIALSAEITADNGDVDLVIDFAEDDSTQYLSVETIYELASDVGSIELVQVAGAAAGTAPDLDWPATPADFQLVAWGTVHNSSASFPTEPTGYTADYTNTATVCAIEVQTADGVTTDPVSFTPTVSGSQFSFHVAALELTDDAGGGVTGTIAATAPPATSAATGTATATATTTASATPATATATADVAVAGDATATAPTGDLAGSATATASATGDAPAPAATTTASANVTVTGTAAPPAPAATAAMAGGVTATGTATPAAPASTTSGSATLDVSGPASTAAPPVATTGTATTTATGTIAATAPPATTTGTGTAASDSSTGTAAATAPPAATAAAGTITATATAAAAAPPAAAGITGTAPIAGTTAATAPAATAVATGTTGEPPPSIDIAHAAQLDDPRHRTWTTTRHRTHPIDGRHQTWPIIRHAARLDPDLS